MSISVWDLFKYLYKWKIFIVIVTIAAFFMATVYVDRSQTYSSKVIIQYDDACISQGKTLDGKTFDVNEIKSPRVILNVLNDLGYKNKKIESVRENITVSAITPKTVENLKSAKEKLGEEYSFFPKTFMITYKGNSSFESTRDILSSLVANYFKYYSETYLYLATLNEVDYNVNKKNFDYIEQAEQIEDNLKQTITALSSYSKDSMGYRSPTTGLTFSDLLKDFERINEYSMPKIFSKIFEGQVTKDEAILIDRYRERLESNMRDMANSAYKAEVAKDRMDSYLNANLNLFNPDEENGGENPDSVSIMQGVEHDDSNAVDEQTTYDNLITGYANDSISANNKKIDMEYCQSIIDKFKLEKSPDINYEEYEAEVKDEIEAVLVSLEELYKKANINISDYNEYIPAFHIKKLSGVSYFENMSGSVLKLIAIIGGFGMSCVAAIVYEIMKKYALYSKENDDNDDADDNEQKSDDKTKAESLA